MFCGFWFLLKPSMPKDSFGSPAGKQWQQPSHLIDNAHGNQIGSLVNAEA
jgi:hypothetical protein